MIEELNTRLEAHEKTTELTNRSSDCAERVEIQSAGKSTKITDKPIDDTEMVKKQSRFVKLVDGNNVCGMG